MVIMEDVVVAIIFRAATNGCMLLIDFVNTHGGTMARMPRLPKIKPKLRA